MAAVWRSSAGFPTSSTFSRRVFHGESLSSRRKIAEWRVFPVDSSVAPANGIYAPFLIARDLFVAITTSGQTIRAQRERERERESEGRGREPVPVKGGASRAGFPGDDFSAPLRSKSRTGQGAFAHLRSTAG